MKFRGRAQHDPALNQQAAAVAAEILRQPVEAAARCEQTSTKAMQMYPSAGGEVNWRSVPNGTGLPKSFILAVTASGVYALEDKQHRGVLVPGNVLKAWDRSGFRAQAGNDVAARARGLADDRQIITLWLPIDGDSGRVAQQIAAQRAASGQRIPALPHAFVIAKDESGQRIIDALGAAAAPPQGAGPNIVIGGRRLEDIVAGAAPQRPAAERLRELEELRAAGAITDADYTRKRAEIIAAI
ncbi:MULTISPECIES: SHOCT domain-containing protein [unclassified Mycobacterium]|uniref:SHOCT domain-containing protein n=1 Tax=unclassified Mycobacterium TaxID=2642494 RepID=UPI0006DCCCA5|nr:MULTISPECIES: SHOCT domain-containing protein [unclassified Mycobacterium]